MVKRVDEYVQVPQVGLLKENLSKSNYEVLEAINKTTVLREVVAEKEETIKLAKEISKSLVPEVQLLATYLRNEAPKEEEEIYTHKKKSKKTSSKKKKSEKKSKPKTRGKKTKKTRRAKGKQVNLKDESDTLKELKKNLSKIRRQLNE